MVATTTARPVGSGAITMTQISGRPLSSSSAIPGPLSKPMRTKTVNLTQNEAEEAVEGEEDGGDGAEEEEVVNEEGKAASVTNTGSDLSSAEEYDSDE